jgi:hypothetical protein
MSEVDGKIKVEFGQKTIRNNDGKDILVNNPQEKILKIIHKGEDSKKYYFRELLNEIKLTGEKHAKKDLEVKVKVKDDERIISGTELYSIAGRSMKSEESGISKSF